LHLQQTALQGFLMRSLFMRLHSIARAFAPWALLGLAAGMPVLAHAAATAQGVALNANASCTNGDLDLTLTTAGATREYGQATNLAGATLYTFEQATPLLATFSGTFTDYQINPLAAPPPTAAANLIGSYAYVGTTPPTAATTAEFFVYYNCSTKQVLLSCYGAYGSCPKTAAAAQAGIPIPALDRSGLALAMLLLALAASVALRRRA
jgi:hypothetical protein